MARSLCRLLFLLLLSFPCWAGTVKVTVKDGDGNALPQAVVTLRPAADGPGGAGLKSPPPPIIVDQRDETFVPYAQVVPVGGSVVFRNSDHVRHHVYSFSPPKQFEFVLAPGEASPPVPLPNVGVVTIGCNIHDHMIAYILVTDAQWSTVTGDDGVAVFANIAPGDYIAQTWHPGQKGGKAPHDLSLALAGAETAVETTVSLSPTSQRSRDPERGRY